MIDDLHTEAVAGLDPDQPVTMLNLMRFHEDSLDGAVALGPEEHGRWDYVALVHYPSPAAFLDMMTSDAYAQANIDRENGCAAHLIMAVDETFNSLAPRPGEPGAGS